MTTVEQYIQLRELTQSEEEAALAYTANSPGLHHLMQGRDGLDCPEFQNHLGGIMPLLPHLRSAAQSYELAAPLTLYAGLGNGYPALGSLWSNDPTALRGLRYSYGGVFSTSTERGVALNFMSVGNTCLPVLLTIAAQVGLRCLPTNVLGGGHEGEVLIAAQSNFLIVDAEKDHYEGDEYIHLKLSGPS